MKQPGFTLIELLIVIAIIGLLASVVLVALNYTRKSARDAKRKQDIQSVRNALELYYQDNGIYPTPQAGAGSAVPLNEAVVAAALSGYIQQLPHDPLCPEGGACDYQYEINSAQIENYAMYGIYIPFETIPPCKTTNSPANKPQWFNSAPLCTF